MITRGRIVRTSRPFSRSSAAAVVAAPSKSCRFFTVGLRSESCPRAFASIASPRCQPSHLGDLALVGDGLLPLGHHRGEEPGVEAQRLNLRRDPVGEVHECLGRQGEALGAQHLPERAMIGSDTRVDTPRTARRSRRTGRPSAA